MTIRVIRIYALATVSVTIALVLTLLITPLHQQFKFLLFVLAVFASATGGIWPGVFATLLSMAMADYFLLHPLRSFAIPDPGNLVRSLLFCGVGFVITWITHRLQRSEEKIRAAAAVVESSADSIMRQGLDNTILSWNKAAELIYGYSAKEAIGRPVSLIVPPERREELQHLVERVHLGGSVQSHETVRIRKDGTHIDVALTLSPVQDRKGKIVGVSSIAREITARKLAEEVIRQSHAKLEQQTHQLRLLAEMGEMLQASSSPADALRGYRPLRTNTHSGKLRCSVCALRIQRQPRTCPPMGRTCTRMSRIPWPPMSAGGFERDVCIWSMIPTPACSAAICPSLHRPATFVPR